MVANGPTSPGVYSNPESVNQAIEDIFTFHPPNEEQKVAYVALREQAKVFAYAIDRYCPAGPDRTAAMRHLRESVMTANASIATNNAQYR